MAMTNSTARGGRMMATTSSARDVRQMVKQMGIGEVNASLVIPSMFLIPRTTDPDAQATILIIQALQQGLSLPATGILDTPTVRALARVSGPGWHAKTWAQLYDDVQAARLLAARAAATGLGSVSAEGKSTSTRTMEGLLWGLGFAEAGLVTRKNKRFDGEYLVVAAMGFAFGFNWQY